MITNWITVKELLDLCSVCTLDIVIYDEEIYGDAADNAGDLLWDESFGEDIPSDVLELPVVSFDIEDTVFRIWALGKGISR